MAFHYTRPPLTQGISSLTLLLTGLGLMAVPSVVSTWTDITATVRPEQPVDQIRIARVGVVS